MGDVYPYTAIVHDMGTFVKDFFQNKALNFTCKICMRMRKAKHITERREYTVGQGKHLPALDLYHREEFSNAKQLWI